MHSMPRRALVQHRPWLVLSLIAAIALPLLEKTAMGGLWLMAIKTCAVGFLAVYAAQRTKGLRAGLFVLALALSALGDLAIELSLTAGGAAFLPATSPQSCSTAATAGPSRASRANGARLRCLSPYR